MIDICNIFCEKTGKEMHNISFLFQDEKIDFEKKFKDMIDNSSENKDKLIILVKANTIVDSKQVICPICKQKSIRLKIKNYKLTLFECDNRHTFNGIKTEEFFNTQKVDLSKINCDKCQNQNISDSYKNMFYNCCHCKQTLYSNCKDSHDESHLIINYDDKCFICDKHGEHFIKYCNNCQLNICKLCEDHNSHNLTYFIDIIPNKEIIVESLNELEAKNNKFKEDIDNIKNIYDKILKN